MTKRPFPLLYLLSMFRNQLPAAGMIPSHLVVMNVHLEDLNPVSPWLERSNRLIYMALPLPSAGSGTNVVSST